MGVRLQRFLGREEDCPPGAFVHVLTRHVPGCAATVVIGCPHCGTRTTLSRDHRIEQGGRVVPAFSCSADPCPFLDYIELESWGEVV